MLYTWNEYDIVNQYFKKKSWEISFISLCLGVGDTPFKVKAFYGFCLMFREITPPLPKFNFMSVFLWQKMF